MFKIGFVNKIFWVINLFLIICTIACYAVPKINPIDFWPIAILGLIFPLLLIINMFFVLFWLIQKKVYFILPLVVIIIGWNYFQRTIQFPDFSKDKRNLSTNQESDHSTVRIMNYNVKNFDYYNWTHNNNLKSRRFFFNFIKKENPDIICFQEFFTLYEHPFKNLDTLVNILNYKWYFFEKKISVKHQHFGIATFSKYPIVRKGSLLFPNSKNNGCIFIDIEMNDDTVRVYNIHLQSFHLGEEDYEYLQEGEVHIQKSRNILHKLKQGYIKRAIQSQIVAKHLSECEYPVIICGDFNDTPLSFAYNTIFKTKKLKDAFVEKGVGFGQTYAGPVPYQRIDFVLFDDIFEINDYYSIKKNYSDHFPVVCDFSFKSSE